MDSERVDAGEFARWLVGTQQALTQQLPSDVPCATCNACCRASQFIHIEPDETSARNAIPAAVRFAAPGLPAGHELMGYDEHGHCPMLVDNACSIYSQRPRACQAYDCRVFAAADISAGDAHKAEVDTQVLRWRFAYAQPSSAPEHQAVRAAAAFLQRHNRHFRHLNLANPTQLALLAIKVCSVFMPGSESSAVAADQPDAQFLETQSLAAQSLETQRLAALAKLLPSA